MTNARHGPAYPPWDEAPSGVPDNLLLLWYVTVCGVLRHNLQHQHPEAVTEAIRQADKVLERIASASM